MKTQYSLSATIRLGSSPAKMCRNFALFFALSACSSFSIAAAGRNRIDDSVVVSALRAEFRNGQVFLIWDEQEKNDQNLRVYLSNEPITAQNLSKAQLLTDQLESHSANDWYDDPDECPHAAGPVHGWIIEAGGRPLDRRGGLFVHTVSRNDPQASYFAVLAQNEEDKKLRTGMNSLSNPVSVSIGQIQAIPQLKDTQALTKGKPLAIFLHSHQGRPKAQLTHLFFGDSSMGWREGLPFKFKISILPDLVLLEPYDRVWINRKMTVEEAKANNGIYDTRFKNIESWWYGTNNKIYEPTYIAAGTPTNYTERWLLWAMNWVEQTYGTDPNRVYAFGASMGTGVLRLVLRNPGRFASVDLLVPILDPFGEGTIGARMKSRVGSAQSICSDGMELSNRLNTISFIKTAKTDLPPMLIRIGRTDMSVSWTRKPDFIKTVQEQKQALFAGWDNGTHSTAMRKSYAGFPDWYDFKWYINHFAIDKSYPALTGCTLDGNPGNGDPHVGDTSGFINRGFDWKIIKDSSSEYKIWLTVKHPAATYPAYVNITPRRYQQFRKNSKTKICYAYNIDANGKIIGKKIFRSDGIITYDKFAVTSPEGNTLVISSDKNNSVY